MLHARPQGLLESASILRRNGSSKARYVIALVLTLGLSAALLPALSGTADAATFGQSEAGRSLTWATSQTRIGSVFQANQSGDSTNFRFYANGGTHDQRFRAVVYATDGAGRPTSLLGTSQETTVKAWQSRTWINAPLTGVKIESGKHYLLGLLVGDRVGGSGFNLPSLLYFNSESNAGFRASNNYPSAPQSWGGANTEAKRWTFALDMNSSGSPSTSTPPTTTNESNQETGSGSETTERINFQPVPADTPSNNTGDTGAGFDGESGWFNQAGAPTSFSDNARERNETDNQRNDTFIHMQLPAGSPGVSGNGYWEHKLANGSYDVTVGVGDPSYTDSRHGLTVEGKSAIDFTPSSGTKHSSKTTRVEVTDGRLTIKPTGQNTKINFVDIAKVAAPTTTTTTAPTTSTTEANNTTPTTPPPVSGNAQPVGGPGGNWNLKFNEDFDGNSVNRSKFPDCHWNTRPGCSGQNADELQVYRPGNTTVSGGSAHLTAKRESVRVPELNRTLNYTSGSLATGSWAGNPSTFKMKYGYAEARIKTAPGKGVWSSFWLAPADMEWPPEIDILEAPNFEENKFYTTLHYEIRNTVMGGQSLQANTPGPNLSQGYHTYAVEWTPTSLKWYFDGKLIRTYTDAGKIPQKDMYLVLNLSVGGWAGTPPSSTRFPATMSVDYVRAWQR
jgi:beta-glucanase (GH16 family)